MEYHGFESLNMDEQLWSSMKELHRVIFVGHDAEVIPKELVTRPRFLILLAVQNGSVVGYKIGYEERAHRFHSWFGGVHAAFRGRGIGSELMRRQHEWCRAHGYTVIRTHTKNKWRDMIILNIRHGFDIVGTYTDEKGEPKIILEKRLTPRER